MGRINDRCDGLRKAALVWPHYEAWKRMNSSLTAWGSNFLWSFYVWSWTPCFKRHLDLMGSICIGEVLSAEPVGLKNLLASHEKCLLGKNRPVQYYITQWSSVLLLPQVKMAVLWIRAAQRCNSHKGSCQGNSSPGGWSDPFSFLPPPFQIIKAFHEWNPRNQPVGRVNLEWRKIPSPWFTS